jgi:hypothetical protein
MSRSEKIAANKLDKEISKLYRENCNGMQINMLDIPRIFEAAKKAHSEGKDMKEAIVSFVESIKKN